MNEKLQEVAIQIISTPKPYQRRPAPLRVRLWNCPRISAAIRWEDRNVKWLYFSFLLFTLGWEYFSAWISLNLICFHFCFEFLFLLMQLKWLNAKNLSALAKINLREITANWSQRPEDKQRKTSSRQSPAENVFIFINFTVFLTHHCRTRILTPQSMAFPSSRFLSFINHKLTPFRTPLHEIFMLEVGGKHFFSRHMPGAVTH